MGLMDAFNDIFARAAENQAGVDATENFAGRYVDKETNSPVTISVDKGRAGLGITNLISRSKSLIGKDSPMFELYGTGTPIPQHP